jgi:hypothetical protein
VAERNDPTEGFSPDAQRAKSGTLVPEDIVLQDYVMLDFDDQFGESSELRITASDTTEQTSTPPLPWAFGKRFSKAQKDYSTHCPEDLFGDPKHGPTALP